MARVTFALAVIAVIALLTLPAPSSRGEAIETAYYDWVQTPSSTTLNTQCTQLYGSGHTCVEWCEVYTGGLFIPTGQFCCQSNGPTCLKPLH